MGERKHSGSYEVTDLPPRRRQEDGWCSTRSMVYVTALACFIVYIIGAIITGVTYRNHDLIANCTSPNIFTPTEMVVFTTPWVVVGPCFMSAGGSILVYLLFQWFLCRPSLK